MSDHDLPASLRDPVRDCSRLFISLHFRGNDDRKPIANIDIAIQCCFHVISGGDEAFGALRIILRQTPQRLVLLREQRRSEEHTSELQSLTRTPIAVFCSQKKKKQ